MRNWLTFKEVADELKIPLKTIYGYHYRGLGPKVTRFGRHLRVLETDLLEWQKESVINNNLSQ